jgi:hypothetical protein
VYVRVYEGDGSVQGEKDSQEACATDAHVSCRMEEGVVGLVREENHLRQTRHHERDHERNEHLGVHVE